MESFGNTPFGYCVNLTSLKVDEGNEVYDSRNDCDAIIETSSNKLIVGCQSTSIPSSVTGFGKKAFIGCTNLKSITISSNVTSIEDLVFQGCDSLMNITVEDGNKVYDSRNDCNAIIETASNKLIAGCQNTVIPSSVTKIGTSAFASITSLKSITIPEGVTDIGNSAFQECTGLTTITIPSSMTSIDDWSFYGCKNLSSIISKIEDPFEISSWNFKYYSEETWNFETIPATLYVPIGTKKKYEATPAWNLLQNIEEMGLEPIEEGETVDFADDIDENTDLDGKVVGDIYYSISNSDGSYDPTEGCIIVSKPTDDNAIDGKDVFGEDFKDNYTGIVFKVSKGKGTVKIQAETTGNMVLKVKIGDNEPITMELEGKLKVSFPYNVSEDTYVYIYGGTNSDTNTNQVNDMRKAPSTDGMLKIFGIEVVRDKGVKGDANGNGDVDITDVLMIVDYVLGRINPDFNYINADVNRDGTVNLSDALYIVDYFILHKE